MAYVRGHARDYDRWAQGGLPGWDYAHVLPYFKKAETYERGGDDYRGDSGPLNVSAGACRNPLFQAWIEAGSPPARRVQVRLRPRRAARPATRSPRT